MKSSLETLECCVEVRGDPAPAEVRATFDGREVLTAFSDPRNSSTIRQYLDDIEANSCTPDAIAYVGQQLWTALFNGPVLGAFWEAYHAFQNRPRAAGVSRLVRLDAWLRDEIVADLFTRRDLRLGVLNCQPAFIGRFVP